MKRTLVVLLVAVAVVIAAYFTGYYRQHAALASATAEVQTLHQQVATANDRLQLAAVLGQLLALTDSAAARNYGEAGTEATRYYDAARAEAARTADASAKQALDSILATRDAVTTALARSEPQVVAALQKQQRTLRQALGYPVPAQ